MIARRAGWIPVVIATLVAFAAMHCHAADVAVSVLPDTNAATSNAIVPSAVIAGDLDAQFRPLAGGNYIPRHDEYDVWLRIDVPTAPADTLRALTIARLPIESLALFRRGLLALSSHAHRLSSHRRS